MEAGPGAETVLTGGGVDLRAGGRTQPSLRPSPNAKHQEPRPCVPFAHLGWISPSSQTELRQGLSNTRHPVQARQASAEGEEQHRHFDDLEVRPRTRGATRLL